MAVRSFFVAVALLALNSGSVTVPEGSIGRSKAGNTQAIFPVAYQSGWTTSTSFFPNVKNLPLSDDSLGVNRVSGGMYTMRASAGYNGSLSYRNKSQCCSDQWKDSMGGVLSARQHEPIVQHPWGVWLLLGWSGLLEHRSCARGYFQLCSHVPE